MLLLRHTKVDVRLRDEKGLGEVEGLLTTDR